MAGRYTVHDFLSLNLPGLGTGIPPEYADRVVLAYAKNGLFTVERACIFPHLDLVLYCIAVSVYVHISDICIYILHIYTYYIYTYYYIYILDCLCMHNMFSISHYVYHITPYDISCFIYNRPCIICHTSSI